MYILQRERENLFKIYIYIYIGLDIAENQSQSLISRKSLASATKEFKKLSDQDVNEKLNQIGNLLKSFQEEVDKFN